jgi:hypothetical protein
MVTLPFDCILSHIVFVENQSFQIKNEIQIMHWHSFEVTILVHTTYKVDPMSGYNEKD